MAAPSSFLLDTLIRLPMSGRCLDVAGGSGRNAAALAAHGFDVTIADFSPEGLAIAKQEIAELGFSVRTLVHDVEQDGLPAGPWDLIVNIHFIHRPLFAAFAGALAPGGHLLVEHQTRSNLERHERPSGHWLLDDGELPGLVEGLEILHSEEDWGADDRHEARLLARKAN